MFSVHHATTKGAPGSAPALPYCYVVGQWAVLAVWER